MKSECVATGSCGVRVKEQIKPTILPSPFNSINVQAASNSCSSM